eukprot:5063570-Prymnesium_polylepis.2
MRGVASALTGRILSAHPRGGATCGFAVPGGRPSGCDTSESDNGLCAFLCRRSVCVRETEREKGTKRYLSCMSHPCGGVGRGLWARAG